MHEFNLSCIHYQGCCPTTTKITQQTLKLNLNPKSLCLVSTILYGSKHISVVLTKAPVPIVQVDLQLDTNPYSLGFMHLQAISNELVDILLFHAEE